MEGLKVMGSYDRALVDKCANRLSSPTGANSWWFNPLALERRATHVENFFVPHCNTFSVSSILKCTLLLLNTRTTDL